MRSFASYISKHLASFAAFILILLFLNAVVFSLTFQKIVTEDYGNSSPQSMLEMTAAAATPERLLDNAVQKLRQNHIWAIYLNADGQCYWSVDLPDEVPESYTIQDVALFSKGYIEDYPVFVWNTDDGLLVLGYPKDSYTKLTSNYYSISALRRLPVFVLGMLGLDVLCLFCAYYFSKRKIIRNTEPIVSAVETLADGKPVSLHISGELSEIANSVNKASSILNRQNEARANWISGVSHDIRTPLALILGWGEQLQQDEALPAAARQKAAGICTQSEKIRSLIGDLNLTSKLQYGAQPLRRKAVTVGPFLRRCAAEFYESPAAGDSTLELELTQAAEHTVVQADEALLLRAIENLLHNAVGHNAVPVHVTIRADAADGMLTIQVTDDGQGYPPAVLAVLQAGETGENPPHILGLHVVEQILAAHGGTAAFAQALPHGAAAALTLPL
mgnify:CR=1 FL=1